jgi:hypothetical protein
MRRRFPPPAIPDRKRRKTEEEAKEEVEPSTLADANQSSPCMDLIVPDVPDIAGRSLSSAW